ncbi:MAG TPA: hypothetical protein VMU58_00220 [Gaiellaceae bacterium]|nr:hypothetical protein [Gaiellaceae bacterium]
MRTIIATPKVTRTVLTAFAAALALLVSAPAAGAAPAATLKATKGCWLDVINDWLDNNRVDKIYAIPCYAQAIQQLNRYPDVQNYSSAADDIRRAELAAIHDRGSSGGGSGGAQGGGGSGGAAGGGTGGSGGGGGTKSPPITSIFNSGKPSSARSVPLPLIVLAGVAGLLLLSAAGTWLVRRIQARRMTPAPAPAVDDRR